MVESLQVCIKRYKRLKEKLQNRNLPDDPPTITDAKPKVITIQRGDTKNIKLWVNYIRLWHPRGFNGSMGRYIKFFIIDEMSGRHLGALSIGTPVYALKPRDDFIGWSREQRIEKINKHVANNWRFLIFPFVEVRNLGSRILSQLHSVAKNEWKKRYGDRLLLLETFVDESECNGAGGIYKAAGWHELLQHGDRTISHFEMKRLGLHNLPPSKTKGYSFVVRYGSKYGDVMRGASKMPKINSKKKIFVKPLHRYWSAFPHNPDEIAQFEDRVMKLAEIWRIETRRKDLDTLGEKIWRAKISPVFLGSPLLKASIPDQKEFLRSVVNEIGLNLTKRWEESNLEPVRSRNGQILLKIAEILSVLHILSDIHSNLTLVRNELDNIESPLFKAVSETITAGQGEHVASQHSTEFHSFLDQFSTLYGCWGDIFSKASDLAEASKVYELIRNLEFDENGIKKFTLEWSKNLRTDIAKEQRGQRINLKKWHTLSRKYANFTRITLSKISDGSITFTGIERTWKEALKRLSYVHTLFVIIADSMSMVDWFSIEDGLDLEGFKILDRFAISTIPTETPVGHASIFSGLLPGDCGVLGRTFIDKNRNVYEIATLGEEDDTHLKVGAEGKFQSEHLRKILNSDNFERKCLIFSPFKGTKLTQILKALVSEKSEFVEDIDYKVDRPFTATTSWICDKLKSLSKRQLINRIVIVQFPNIDKRGHKAEWDEHIYFEKMEQEVNRILQVLKGLCKREKMRVGVLLTSDHGKLLRWEVNRILSVMDKIDEEAGFSVVADIVKRKLTHFRQIHEPVLSAKYVMGWIEEDVAKVTDEIVSTVKDKVGVYLPSAQHLRLFTGKDVSDLLGGKGNENIVYPNFLLVSLYQFGGPGRMQHSGLSLGELIVPFIYMEVGTS